MSDELIARIEALEAKVAELYRLLDHPQPAAAADTGAAAAFPPEVVELALAGNKIQAIKLLRERTGLGLAEAKTVVDQIA
ncbi:MAG: ribosomal protein L7/L12 [Thermoleophilia bacterium]|jgi:large subunit ribosomal protein L7/L12